MQEVKELLKPYNQQFLDLNEDLVEPYVFAGPEVLSD